MLRKSFDKTCKLSLEMPVLLLDEFLSKENALALHDEINNIPSNSFDRYQNPFENKYTLRNKFHPLCPLLAQLWQELESPEFLSCIELLVGTKLIIDHHRHYSGVHVFKSGDYLDIHVDAGVHPLVGKKKFLTFGYYLTHSQYESSMGGQLEFWEGDSAVIEEPKLNTKILSIEPISNRAVFFLNSDHAWHGAPTKYTSSFDRIFITTSYMCEDIPFAWRSKFQNNMTRAYFAPLRSILCDEKKELRRLRASENCHQIYKIHDNEVWKKEEKN